MKERERERCSPDGLYHEHCNYTYLSVNKSSLVILTGKNKKKEKKRTIMYKYGLYVYEMKGIINALGMLGM